MSDIKCLSTLKSADLRLCTLSSAVFFKCTLSPADSLSIGGFSSPDFGGFLACSKEGEGDIEEQVSSTGIGDLQ